MFPRYSLICATLDDRTDPLRGVDSPYLLNLIGADERTRTSTPVKALEPESSASASSATSAVPSRIVSAPPRPVNEQTGASNSDGSGIGPPGCQQIGFNLAFGFCGKLLLIPKDFLALFHKITYTRLPS